MKWCIAAIAAACLAGSGAAEETRQQRGKRVVDEALKALGGEAFLRMEDRVESGRAYSFYRQELTGLSIAKIYTRYLAPVPGELAVRERETFGKDESSAVLLTEKQGWEITFRGARPLDDERFARYHDSTLRNILYILRQRLNEPGMTFYSQGTDFWENRPVEVVDITDAANATVTVYFDQLSKFPVRQVYRRRNSEYKDFDTEVSVFAKYRDVGGGVMWPCTLVRERNKQKIFEMYSDSVEINKNLTDDLFTLPSGMKILKTVK